MRPPVDRFDGALLVVGMMAPVVALKHLDRHPEIASRLPYLAAVLHEPCRAGVP